MGMPAPDFSMLVIAALASVAAGLAYAVIEEKGRVFLPPKYYLPCRLLGLGA